MQRITICGVLVVSFLCLCLVLPASAAEMRGLWADAFHPGFKTPEETSAMVTKAKDCNFNALFVQVRRRGDVYYKSSIEPMAADTAPAYDPLADIVAKAHKAGLEVHAWISVYEVYHENRWAHSKAPVRLAHPEWLMKDSRGRTTFPGERVYLDPGVPEVQDYLVRIVEEIAGKYQVDGIHFDLIRYPGLDSGYNDASVAAFNKAKGKQGAPPSDDNDWCEWRRSSIRQFVEASYRKATKARPGIKLSSTVSADKNIASREEFQDWEGWLKAGILDFAVPLLFIPDSRVFDSLAQEALASGNGRHVYIGQGGFDMSVARTLAQVEMARQAHANGIVVYSYYCCQKPGLGESTSIMDALKAGPFAKPDTVPALSWKR